MSSSAHDYNSILDWPYVDSPWDLLIECESLRLGLAGATYPKCVTTTVLGVWSAYITPVVCSIGLFGTIVVVVALLLHARHLNRQLIYIVFMFSANAAVYLIFSMPQTIAYLVAYALSRNGGDVNTEVRLAYSIADLGWNLYFLIEVFNIVILLYFSSQVRKYVLSLFPCLPKKLLVSNDATIITVYLIFSMPQTIAYLAAYALSRNGGDVNTEVRLAYSIADLGWNLYFLIEVFNIVILLYFSSQVRKYVLSLFPCLPKKLLVSNDATIITVYLIFSMPQTIAYLVAYALSRNGRGVNTEVRLAYNIADLGWNLYFLIEYDNHVYLIFSMPQTIAYLAAYALSRNGGDVNTEVRLAYSIADLGWNLYFLIEVFNIVVLLYFSSQVRKVRFLFVPVFAKIFRKCRQFNQNFLW
ncbi:hypothetical protein AHF37_02770 [Paragonimus kellicotti]|nr:hypothetical protein AHF37_02770 [Paragonimus kellicotti]